MKKLNRCCSLITGFIFLLSLLSMCLTSVVSAEDEFVAEQKVYCSATINDAFADDSILVVLNNEASLEYLETEKMVFPEVKYKRVRELTAASRKRIKSIIEERKNTSLVERMLTSDPNAHEIAEYHHVVCIELEERGKDKVLEAVALLEQREDVLYAGPDYIITGYSDSAINTTSNEYPVPEDIINLPEAENMVTGAKPVIVGVLDSGIDATHPALAGMVEEQSLSKNFVDYGNDKPEEVNISPLTDPNGHGTHVAGIIAETAGNVKLVSLRVLDSNNQGKSSFLIDALEYVKALACREDNPIVIPILNLSAGWKVDVLEPINHPKYDKPVKEAIENYGGLFVCGAGNKAKKVISNSISNNDEIIFYPASYTFINEDKVIVVGASNQTDNGLWMGTSGSGSNYGQLAVDIFAPGDTILSCYPSALCVNCFKEDGSLKDTNHVAVGY